MKTTFGKHFRALRQEAGRSLKDVADHMGWSIPYVSDIERGMRNPPAHTHIVKLANYLGRAEEIQRLDELAAAFRGGVTVIAENPNDLAALVALNRKIQDRSFTDRQLERLRELLDETK